MTIEQKFGVAWFEPDQWEDLLAVSADASKLGTSYEEWVATVNQAIKNMRANGIVTTKVSIDVAELVVWSTVKGVKIDASARSGFVTHKLLQNDKK